MNDRDITAALSGRRKVDDPDAFEIRCMVNTSFAGLSPSGSPVLLIPLASGPFPVGRLLGSIRTTFRSDLTFLFEDKTWCQPAATLECLEPLLLDTFCALVRDVAESVDSKGTASDVLAALRAWDELLRRRDQISDSEEVGLWGELSTLLSLPDLDAGIAAWRGPEGDTMDFRGGGVAMECKTSTLRRRHHVSLDQGRHIASKVDSYLVSLWVQEDAVIGTTLTNLVNDLGRRISDTVLFRRKLLAAGYRDDHHYARRLTLVEAQQLFAMQDVPTVKQWDSGVLGIRYIVDLSQVTPLSGAESGRVSRRLCGRGNHE